GPFGRTTTAISTSRWHPAPGREDADVGDLDRGRGMDTSLHAEAGVPVVDEASRRKELGDLTLAEPEPDVGLLGPHPFVGVLHLVGDGHPASWSRHPGHLAHHAGRV